MRITIANALLIHHQGKRENQEDSYFKDNADKLFMVCDGMGGHEHGEVASKTVCEAFRDYFKEYVKPDVPLDDNLLKGALELAYKRLDALDDGSIRKMGTTLTLLYIHKHGATIAHIGDSRIYHIRPYSHDDLKDWKKAILYHSKDDSVVFEKYWRGEISYEQMATDPQKNIITQAVTPGIENRARLHIYHTIDINPGDYFYLCSDGMLESMSNEELVDIFSENITDEEKRQRLLDETSENHDNHTAWIVRVGETVKEQGDPSADAFKDDAKENAMNRPDRSDWESDSVEVVPAEEVVVVDNGTARKPQVVRPGRQAPPPPRQPMQGQPQEQKSSRGLFWMACGVVAALVIFLIVGLLFPFKGCTGKEQKVAEKDTTKVENLKVSVTKPSIKPNDSIVEIETKVQNTRIEFTISGTNKVDTLKHEDNYVKLKFKENGKVTAWTVDGAGNESDINYKTVELQNEVNSHTNQAKRKASEDSDRRRKNEYDKARSDAAEAEQGAAKAERDADKAKQNLEKAKQRKDRNSESFIKKAKETQDEADNARQKEDEAKDKKRT